MSLTTADGKPCEGIEQGRFEPIAVIGLGALMPDADDVDGFWQNILDSKVSIVEVDQDRWPGKIEHFWKKGGPGDIEEGLPIQKSVLLLRILNLIGEDGANHQAL